MNKSNICGCVQCACVLCMCAAHLHTPFGCLCPFCRASVYEWSSFIVLLVELLLCNSWYDDDDDDANDGGGSGFCFVLFCLKWWRHWQRRKTPNGFARKYQRYKIDGQPQTTIQYKQCSKKLEPRCLIFWRIMFVSSFKTANQIPQNVNK